MIRILYTDPIPPEVDGSSYGGIATHLWDLANQARKHDYDVYILANTTHSFTYVSNREISGFFYLEPLRYEILLKNQYRINIIFLGYYGSHLAISNNSALKLIWEKSIEVLERNSMFIYRPDGFKALGILRNSTEEEELYHELLRCNKVYTGSVEVFLI